MPEASHQNGELVKTAEPTYAHKKHQIGECARPTDLVILPAMANKQLQPPNRIRELRLAKGLSQEQLGALVGVSGETIAKLERRERGVDIQWMTTLAPHLGVEPWEIVADVPKLTPNAKAIMEIWDKLKPEGRAEIRHSIDREARYLGIELPELIEPDPTGGQ